MEAPLIRVGFDAHTVGRQQTGNERYTVELATALERRSDVDVVAYIDRDVDWPAWARPAPELRHLRLRQPQLRIPLELPVRTRRDRVDLLQVSYVAPPFVGVPLVTIVHDLSFEDLPETFPRPTRLRLQSLVRLSVRRSSAVVAVSEFTRRRLIEHYDLDPGVVHHVRSGVSAMWQRADADAVADFARRHHLSARFVLAVGTDHRRKNLGRLVESVARARSATSDDLGLVIAGPAGRGDGELERVVEQYGATAWVKRLGYVDDEELRILYSACSAFAYVSTYEGFGLPVLEALSCGATVVASSTTAVAETAGDACVLVDPEDAADIAGGIERALVDGDLRTELDARRRDHLARFSWDACADSMVDVYRAALDRRA